MTMALSLLLPQPCSSLIPSSPPPRARKPLSAAYTCFLMRWWTSLLYARLSNSITLRCRCRRLSSPSAVDETRQRTQRDYDCQLSPEAPFRISKTATGPQSQPWHPMGPHLSPCVPSSQIDPFPSQPFWLKDAPKVIWSKVPGTKESDSVLAFCGAAVASLPHPLGSIQPPTHLPTKVSRTSYIQNGPFLPLGHLNLASKARGAYHTHLSWLGFPLL